MAPSGPPPAAKAKAKGDKKDKKPVKKAPEDNLEDKIPKVEKPDREVFEEKVGKKNDRIEGLQKELAVLAKKIGEKSHGKDEHFAKKTELRQQLDEQSAKMDELQARKEALQKAIGDRVSEGKQLREAANKMKREIGYTDAQQIDERIATIEYTLWTSSLTLKEEKKYLAEVQELKRTRPKVAHYHKMEEKVQNFDTGGNVKEQIAAINEEMAFHREKKKEVQAKYRELVEERQSQMGNMTELFEEREKINKLIGEQIKERNDLRNDFRQAERDFNAYLAEVRKVRQERAQEQRAERDREWEAERKKRAVEKLEDNPYVSDIALVEQTLLWCNSMLPKEEVKAAEKKATVHTNTAKEEVLLKKEDREEEYFFAPTKSKKKGKNKGGDKAEEKGSGAIKHNMETFHLFSQLKLDAPLLTSDIPATIDKLGEMMEGFKDKVKAWEAKRDAARERIAQGLDPFEDKKKDDEDEDDKGGDDDDDVHDPIPESLSSNKNFEKKNKKVSKEGGKRGVEIEGAADMGGLQFFCTSVDEPAGDVDWLYESLRAMNAKSDPSEEERKGGSGHVGKMLLSINETETCAMVSYVPKKFHGQIKADSWLKDVLGLMGAPASSFVAGNANTAKALIKTDSDKGLFPLKLKDSGISLSIDYLKKRGLFPDKDDEDDDEMVFGDDDFPE